jgi:hypothetical protein
MPFVKGQAKTPNSGRKKGVSNKKHLELLQALEVSGETPLEFMFRVMRDEHADKARRDDMAKAAAPYVHRRLASLEQSGPEGAPVQVVISWDESEF